MRIRARRCAARTRAFLATLPAATRTVAACHLHAGGAADGAWSHDPYWLALPQWLNRRLRVHGSPGLRDILWAQYCLFVFVRLQDDVLDRQAGEPRLLFVAHEFLAEAERALAARVRDARVWRFYRRALQETARGILEADVLQRRERAGVDQLLATYVRVSAILKVGAAAVCLPAGARGCLKQAERCADRLAIAGQLLDDLEDVYDDLDDGRLNAAARLLAPGASPADPSAVRRALSRALGSGNADPVVGRITRDAALASAAIAPLRLPGAAGYLRAIDRELAGIGPAIHRARVAAVFGAARRPA